MYSLCCCRGTVSINLLKLSTWPEYSVTFYQLTPSPSQFFVRHISSSDKKKMPILSLVDVNRHDVKYINVTGCRQKHSKIHKLGFVWFHFWSFVGTRFSLLALLRFFSVCRYGYFTCSTYKYRIHCLVDKKKIHNFPPQVLRLRCMCVYICDNVKFQLTSFGREH
jgi:hypothetical protein